MSYAHTLFDRKGKMFSFIRRPTKVPRKVSPPQITIDMKHDMKHSMYDAAYYARKIWEALFRAIGPEKIAEQKSLDSFLCDLKGFEEMISTRQYDFWWVANLGGNFMTTYIYGYENYGDVAYKVVVEPGEKITLTVVGIPSDISKDTPFSEERT